MAWSADDIVDLTGKVFVVTGANGGLGSRTTLALARKGAHVVMGCRSESKARAAMEQIRGEVDDARLELVPLDLADLDSVEAFAHQTAQSHPQIHGLINNAGVMAIPFRKTAQGFEMQMGVNHFGHFALTGRLLPQLRAAPGARVVTVASNLHQLGKIHFDDLDWEHDYAKWPAYGQSKLANLLFAYELQRRLSEAKLGVQSMAAHPGYADTELQVSGAQMAGQGLSARVLRFSSKVAAQSPAAGALPSLYAATAPQAEGGAYYGPGTLNMWGAPKKVDSNARSKDRSTAERLWTLSEQRTGVTFSFES